MQASHIQLDFLQLLRTSWQEATRRPGCYSTGRPRSGTVDTACGSAAEDLGGLPGRDGQQECGEDVFQEGC